MEFSTPLIACSIGTPMVAATTSALAPGYRVLTWMVGGLNHQIEHHLFPRVAHTHYPQIAPIVQRNALKHGIRYTAHPSLRAALHSHAGSCTTSAFTASSTR